MLSRRRVLAALGLSVLGLSGCTDVPPTGTDDDDPGQAGGTPSPDRRTTRARTRTPTETETETATSAPTESATPTETGTPGETANGTRTGEPSGTEAAPRTETANATETTGATETGTPGTTTPRTELDLREANVVDVAFEADDGTYRFDVTLIHDDDGEDGYANWWQVEDLEGTQLGRRKLLHPHGTREFTRSETMSVPDDVTCVVVRGHDQTHGYGGSVVLVNLETAETVLVYQGSDPVANAELASSCP
jgi:hypothetical protein